MFPPHKILLLLAAIALCWLFSASDYPRQPKVHHPVEDTVRLLDHLEKLGAGFEKGLWEAVATDPEPISGTEWRLALRKLEEAFGLPEAEPVLKGDGHWEYISVRELAQAGRLSLRFLAIPAGNGAYQTQLILKLETTAIHMPAVTEFVKNSREKLQDLGYISAFYTCISGATDDKLDKVGHLAVRAFSGRQGQLEPEYRDETTRIFRRSGPDQLQVMIHWNGDRKKTEITLGIPLIITEF